ncbi:MAG: chemotaxis protein CheD [Desulfovibrionaceae bacterium]|nr:chemotaxis protein CheD [Desulfovibrionaceae bacterium]
MRELVNLYPDLESVYLLVAQGGVYERPTLVQTVLGSCVSVAFFSRQAGMGGIFHALLPHSADYEKVLTTGNRYRYVDAAVAAVAASLERRGVDLSETECKVFGGASALFQGEVGVGQKNVLAAYEALARHKLRVTASHVGGERGRKLVFFSHTGEVFVKFLKSVGASCRYGENGRLRRSAHR